jgi:hypothetical protein
VLGLSAESHNETTQNLSHTTDRNSSLLAHWNGTLHELPSQDVVASEGLELHQPTDSSVRHRMGLIQQARTRGSITSPKRLAGHVRYIKKPKSGLVYALAMCRAVFHRCLRYAISQYRSSFGASAGGVSSHVAVEHLPKATPLISVGARPYCRLLEPTFSGRRYMFESVTGGSYIHSPSLSLYVDLTDAMLTSVYLKAARLIGLQTAYSGHTPTAFNTRIAI